MGALSIAGVSLFSLNGGIVTLENGVNTYRNSGSFSGVGSYTATYQRALNILFADGVLENDTDPGGHALRAVSVQTAVAHGTLTPNTDGSFVDADQLTFTGIWSNGQKFV